MLRDKGESTSLQCQVHISDVEVTTLPYVPVAANLKQQYEPLQ